MNVNDTPEEQKHSEENPNYGPALLAAFVANVGAYSWPMAAFIHYGAGKWWVWPAGLTTVAIAFATWAWIGSLINKVCNK